MGPGTLDDRLGSGPRPSIIKVNGPWDWEPPGGTGVGRSVPSCCIMGRYTCTKPMDVNGCTHFCIILQESSNLSTIIAWVLFPFAGSCVCWLISWPLS